MGSKGYASLRVAVDEFVDHMSGTGHA
jgi:hypothetical protein